MEIVEKIDEIGMFENWDEMVVRLKNVLDIVSVEN